MANNILTARYSLLSNYKNESQILGHKKDFWSKNFCTIIILVNKNFTKKIFYPKNFGSRKFLGRKKFGSKKNLVERKF